MERVGTIVGGRAPMKRVGMIGGMMTKPSIWQYIHDDLAEGVTCLNNAKNGLAEVEKEVGAAEVYALGLRERLDKISSLIWDMIDEIDEKHDQERVVEP